MTGLTAQRTLSAADAVGMALAETGLTDVFGLLGSGNLVVTNALCSAGASFHSARHEGGAVSMADGYARVSGRVGICTVHQGPGLTNAITGLTEAVKSRTPLLLLAGEAPAASLSSNFRIDQSGLVEAVGAASERIADATTAASDALRAYARAVRERRPVVLMLPIDIQPQPLPDDMVSAGAANGSAPAEAVRLPTEAAPRPPDAAPSPADAVPSPADAIPPPPPAHEIAAVADLLAGARRPVIVAGRGAVLSNAAADLERLAALTGALLATSAPAKGLFNGLPFALGIAGGFASPHAASLLPQADVVLVAGASVNHWTTRRGKLIGCDARVVQIDIERDALGRNRPAHLSLLGDVAASARALVDELSRRGHRAMGWRTPETALEIAAHRWPATPYEDASTDDWIDPRTLSMRLDELLPPDRAVAVDSGHFLGWPSMFLEVPDARAWVFPNGFQSVGLGLGSAIGAAIARPDRPTVAAIGDGGAFMALGEIDTAVRERLKLLVLIYDDCAYGAEVHHFASLGHDVSRARFPDADLAAIARGAGALAATIRAVDDLDVVGEWLAEADPRPLVLDAKVTPTVCADWLAEAFEAG